MPVVIYGNGQVAELALARLLRDSDHPVAGFTVDRQCIAADTLHGLPVVPFDSVAERWPPQAHVMLIAVGHTGVNRLRAERYRDAARQGYRFINLLSPRASLWPDLQLGDNCIIGDNCIVSPYVRIGSNVHVGSGCIVGHHVTLGDHCYLAAGVTLAGSVQVEPYAFLGVGVTVRDRVRIGESAYLGAGVVLSTNARPGGVYAAPEPHLLPITSDRLPHSR